MEIIQTQRGAPCIINDGHRYRRDKKRESHTTWRCCFNGCPSRCTTAMNPTRSSTTFSTSRRVKTYWGTGLSNRIQSFFVQLYTLHGYTDGMYSPRVFALLPDKKKPTYIRMLQLLQSACNERNFTLSLATVHTDLEVTMISAVHYIWPEAVVALCNFHLCQAWYRNIQAFNLTRDYRDVKSLVGRWLRLVGEIDIVGYLF